MANDLRNWFLMRRASIGLEFSFGSLKEAGWKPVLVFAAATVVNLSVGCCWPHCCGAASSSRKLR